MFKPSQLGKLQSVGSTKPVRANPAKPLTGEVQVVPADDLVESTVKPEASQGGHLAQTDGDHERGFDHATRAFESVASESGPESAASAGASPTIVIEVAQASTGGAATASDATGAAAAAPKPTTAGTFSGCDTQASERSIPRDRTREC